MSQAIRAADAELRQIARTGDAMDPWVREMVGKSVQLRIPLRDPVDLVRCAEILRGFATRMEVAAKSRDTAQGIVLRIWGEARATQGKLQSYPQGARKKDGG